MPKKKYIEQKKLTFDDVAFSMTSFCAKKSKKLGLVGKKKKKQQQNLKIVSKVP